jgi:hypothetical protein
MHPLPAQWGYPPFAVANHAMLAMPLPVVPNGNHVGGDLRCVDVPLIYDQRKKKPNKEVEEGGKIPIIFR